MLTIPRELSIDQDRLVQTPIIELQNLRAAEQRLENGLNPIDTGSFELELELKEKFSIRFSNQAGEFVFFEADENYTLDRTNQGIDLNLAYGSVRRARRINTENQKVQLYYDKSCLEIFVDGGKTVFTSRIFLKSIQSIEIDGLKEGVLYQMKRIQYLK